MSGPITNVCYAQEELCVDSGQDPSPRDAKVQDYS